MSKELILPCFSHLTLFRVSSHADIRQCEGVAIKECWLARVNFDALDRDTIKVHDGTKMTKKPYDLGGKRSSFG